MGFRDFFFRLLGRKEPDDPESAAAASEARPRSQPEEQSHVELPVEEPRCEPAPAPEMVTESAPEVATESAPPATEDPAPPREVDVGEELDAALGAVFGGGPAPQPGPISTEDKWEGHDREATGNLFGEIAELQAQPIRNFIFELRRGSAKKESLEICRPIVASLIEAAESIGIESTAKSLADFDEALEMADGTTEPEVCGEARDLILTYYGALEAVLGEADQRREGLIIHSLLRQVPDVGHVTFERLYGAGITSLDPLYIATPDDLSNTTGIPLWLSERICEKLQEHRNRIENVSADAQNDLLERLIELVDEFHRQHRSLREADELPPVDPERESLRREFRKGRQTCALQINVLLAELGQLDMADEIQKLGYERRIERLEHYIAEVT